MLLSNTTQKQKQEVRTHLYRWLEDHCGRCWRRHRWPDCRPIGWWSLSPTPEGQTNKGASSLFGSAPNRSIKGRWRLGNIHRFFIVTVVWIATEINLRWSHKVDDFHASVQPRSCCQRGCNTAGKLFCRISGAVSPSCSSDWDCHASLLFISAFLSVYNHIRDYHRLSHV